jgi:RNA polymerase sigma-70 factor (ECF subfamily)
MHATPLLRARAGDQQAFRELTDPYRRELELHCYRIVGSLQDAEDLLQETLLAAWRGLEQFEERASIRAWLYRIATNRGACESARKSYVRALRGGMYVAATPSASPRERAREPGCAGCPAVGRGTLALDGDTLASPRRRRAAPSDPRSR